MTATITREVIDPAVYLPGLYRNDCGAVNLFLGVVRDHHLGRAVVSLEYEAYEEMAIAQMGRIAGELVHRNKLGSFLVVHRVGKLKPGDVSLLVAVVSAHRKECLHATAEFVWRLKRDVPIWKKESYLDGESCWIGCSHEHGEPSKLCFEEIG